MQNTRFIGNYLSRVFIEEYSRAYDMQKRERLILEQTQYLDAYNQQKSQTPKKNMNHHLIHFKNAISENFLSEISIFDFAKI